MTTKLKANQLDEDYALKSNVLELDNTSEFTPDADYEPATKKYVDDNARERPKGIRSLKCAGLCR